VNCDAETLIEAAQCFRCAPPGTAASVHTHLLCQWAASATEPINPLLPIWVQDVIDNGGEMPTDKTQAALNIFSNGLDSAGLTSKMLAVNCLVPDSLAAAQVPLIHVKGNAVWANSGHIASELTVNGLKGVGSDPPHYLETGFNPFSDLTNSNSFGMTLYSYDADNTTRSDFSSIETTVPDRVAQLLTSYSGTAYFFCFSTVNSIGAAALTDSRGYTSGNRTSATDMALYVANESVAHHSIASSNVPVVGNRPNVTVPLGTWHRNASYAGAGSAKRFSFAAIHYGLTQAESATFFTLVQAMRKALGGGWV